MAEVTATVRVEGLKSLDEALRDLPKIVADEILGDALRDAGAVVLRAARDNIRSRTGKTEADLRVEVQLSSHAAAGAAAVGGSLTGKDGRAHVLRWLEFGTKPHRIVAGDLDRRTTRGVVRSLRRIGDRGAARAVRQRVTFKRALATPSKLFGSVVNHPGTRAQGPLLRALSEQGDRAVAVFRDRLWTGVAAAVDRLRAKGGA